MRLRLGLPNIRTSHFHKTSHFPNISYYSDEVVLEYINNRPIFPINLIFSSLKIFCSLLYLFRAVFVFITVISRIFFVAIIKQFIITFIELYYKFRMSIYNLLTNILSLFHVKIKDVIKELRIIY